MPRLLIVGGGSFVGNHLTHSAQIHGWDVIVSAQYGDLCCDVERPDTIARVLDQCRPDAIVNCAAVTISSDPSAFDKINVDGSRNLLKVIAEFSQQTPVILFGSAAEFGSAPVEWLPFREDHPTRPNTPYGVSKVRQLEMAQQMTRSHGLRVAVLRPFNIIGPDLPRRYFIAELCHRLKRSTPLSERTFPLRNGDHTRDFVDVRDVAEAVLCVLESEIFQPGEVQLFHVATGVETSVREVAEYVGQLAGGMQPEDEPGSPIGIQRSCGDAERLRGLGWRAKWAWPASVRQLWEQGRIERAA